MGKARMAGWVHLAVNSLFMRFLVASIVLWREPCGLKQYECHFCLSMLLSCGLSLSLAAKEQPLLDPPGTWGNL